MSAPFNKLRSKVDRAIAAYLISVGAGGPDDTVPANTRLPKAPTNTTVRSTLSISEVPMTGIRRVKLQISIKGSALIDPNEPNIDEARKAFDDRIAAVYDAMMQSADGQTLRDTAAAITAAGRAMAVSVQPGDPASDLFAANNADMVDFTCQAVYDMGEGDGEADSEGSSWHEILLFDIIASPSNVD